MIEIWDYSLEEFEQTDEDHQIKEDIRQWSELWFDEWKQTDIEHIYLAWDDNDVVGFQTVNREGNCTAIEIKPTYRGKGIACLLIESSGCITPDRNYNPAFWENINSIYG